MKNQCQTPGRVRVRSYKSTLLPTSSSQLGKPLEKLRTFSAEPSHAPCSRLPNDFSQKTIWKLFTTLLQSYTTTPHYKHIHKNHSILLYYNIVVEIIIIMTTLLIQQSNHPFLLYLVCAIGTFDLPIFQTSWRQP